MPYQRINATRFSHQQLQLLLRIPHSKCLYAPRRRCFHDYFVTHIQSPSLKGEKQPTGPSSDTSSKDTARNPGQAHDSNKPSSTSSRDETIVRIPLRKAKQHFGVLCGRGTRPYNEDSFQAGTIQIPAFAKTPPLSLTGRNRANARFTQASNRDTAASKDGEEPSNNLAGEDPQVFYFGVFDGHGGDQCSHFLRDKLHYYLEDAALRFGMKTTLVEKLPPRRNSLDDEMRTASSASPAQDLAKEIVRSWKDTVGGYFRRFQPEFFAESSGGRGGTLRPSILRDGRLDLDMNDTSGPSTDSTGTAGIERVLTYTHLSADFDFVTQQVNNSANQDRTDSDPSDLDNDACLGRHSHHSAEPFLGGSTSSIILISTPTPTPFWDANTPSTLATAHLGDTRILLCHTETGAAVPLTTNHHPSTPAETARLRRYAAAFTTDSFGEERFATGLANTRAFGDVRSKRMGVSAEPEIKLLHLRPAECSFLVLMSDGVSGILSDQEVVDVVKESRTPEEGAKSVADLAEELAEGEKGDSDNVTCLVVRLGGWERRAEGGGGSLGTKEGREWRKREASDPRRGRNM